MLLFQAEMLRTVCVDFVTGFCWFLWPDFLCSGWCWSDLPRAVSCAPSAALYWSTRSHRYSSKRAAHSTPYLLAFGQSCSAMPQSRHSDPWWTTHSLGCPLLRLNLKTLQGTLCLFCLRQCKDARLLAQVSTLQMEIGCSGKWPRWWPCWLAHSYNSDLQHVSTCGIWERVGGCTRNRTASTCTAPAAAWPGVPADVSSCGSSGYSY